MLYHKVLGEVNKVECTGEELCDMFLICIEACTGLAVCVPSKLENM